MYGGRAVTVRLHGIDAPEMGQPYGRASKQAAITYAAADGGLRCALGGSPLDRHVLPSAFELSEVISYHEVTRGPVAITYHIRDSGEPIGLRYIRPPPHSRDASPLM